MCLPWPCGFVFLSYKTFFSGVLQVLDPSTTYCQLFPRQRVRRTLRNWQAGCCSAATWIPKGTGWRLQGFLRNILLNEAVPPPTHTLCDLFCYHLGLVAWEHNTAHPSCPRVAHPCLLARCIHQQEQAVGRFCFKTLSDRHAVINFEVLTSSTSRGEADPRVLPHLYAARPHSCCSPAAQPPAPRCWAACAARWHAMRTKFKGRNKV